MQIKEFTSAISTPLASIFGSGFLVMIPILVSAVGQYALYAMMAIIILAYNVGNVIRFNIKNIEPLLEFGASKITLKLEKASDFSLVLAYIVSISLYLHIMSVFVLTGLNLDSNFNEDILTTVVIVTITFIGVTKGLKPLEILEEYALFVTLMIVVILIISFGIYDFNIYKSSKDFIMPIASKHSLWEIITILAGMLIVIQGFETSRYLGSSYSMETRILTSKYSQIISSVVYMTFITLAIPIVHKLNGVYDDNSLIVLVGFVSAILVAPLIIIAALSQFSAAIADTLAATGNIQEFTRKKISLNTSYLLVGIVAIVITWSMHTLEILALASRAFALYYLLQTLVAISISKNLIQIFFMLILALILAFITIFAVPAG
ncbi:hypothetical protein [Sulfurimonas sp.]|uniref:hypothetical protein n=1 Tax=Sulfurimonas sp. TaxID=2022749 RepID=UPI002AB02AE2|nr:hypothetical protein [Sulfurimonas sp.]